MRWLPSNRLPSFRLVSLFFPFLASSFPTCSMNVSCNFRFPHTATSRLWHLSFHSALTRQGGAGGPGGGLLLLLFFWVGEASFCLSKVFFLFWLPFHGLLSISIPPLPFSSSIGPPNFILPSVHPSVVWPEDRNASPAQLCSIW